jgi:C_GCAxxG_C_C family probable redox protein
MRRSDIAIKAFNEGANCAQSVVLAFAGDFNLDRDTALALSRGFGSGMAVGGPCGVLSGAVIVIGLSTGIGANNNDAKPKAYAMVKEFTTWFKSQVGSTLCRDLIGCDISLPEQARAAREKGTFQEICAPMIREMVEKLEETVGVSR